MSDLATACYDAELDPELESVLEHQARLSVQATQRIANFIQTNQYDEIQIINPATGNLSPNPPKRWAVALTPGMMGKGRRTGQARFQ